MTREDVKKQFPDATDEQISAMLDQHNKEIQTERSKASENDAELERLHGIEQQYNDQQAQNMTDQQKLDKALKDAETERANLQKSQNRIEVEKVLVQAGLTEEDYKDYIDNLVSDDKDASVKLATSITGTIKAKAEQAGKDKETELMDNLGDKGGAGGGDGGNDTKSDAEKFAESHAKLVSGNSKSTSSIVGAYLGGKE